MRWTLIASIAVNALCQYFRGPSAFALVSLACIVALVVSRRAGAAITAVLYMITMRSAHEFLIFSIALIVAAFPSPRQMVLLLKIQITTLWVFTGISKLHPEFRSGEVFRRGPLFLFDHVPQGLVIWGTAAAELLILPVLLWWKPRIAFWVALAFQTSVFVGMIHYRAGWPAGREFGFQASLFSFELAVIGTVYAIARFSRRGAGAARAVRRAHAR